MPIREGQSASKSHDGTTQVQRSEHDNGPALMTGPKNPMNSTIFGAGDGTRTHDILLGKQTLYQLSYTRMLLDADYSTRHGNRRRVSRLFASSSVPRTSPESTSPAPGEAGLVLCVNRFSMQTVLLLTQDAGSAIGRWHLNGRAFRFRFRCRWDIDWRTLRLPCRFNWCFAHGLGRRLDMRRRRGRSFP